LDKHARLNRKPQIKAAFQVTIASPKIVPDAIKVANRQDQVRQRNRSINEELLHPLDRTKIKT